MEMEQRHINDVQVGDRVTKSNGRKVTVTNIQYPAPTGNRLNERGEWGPSYSGSRVMVEHKSGHFWVTGDSHLQVHDPGPLPVGSRVFRDRRY